MQNLETNLRSTAGYAFRLYPEIYPVNQPMPESTLRDLADGYGREDGFYDAGMTEE